MKKNKEEILEKENKELREKVKGLEEVAEKYKKTLVKRIKYCNELEKDLFENCENYVVNKQKIIDKIQERKFELQQEYKDFEDDKILQVLEELLQEEDNNEN